MKVFKILNPKKAGTAGDSDSERDFQTNFGNKNIKALVEECNKKVDELSAFELKKKTDQMR